MSSNDIYTRLAQLERRLAALEAQPLPVQSDGAGNVTVSGALALTDGITAPSATVGVAKIYVDTADGDLKVRFGDGITKTLATDT